MKDFWEEAEPKKVNKKKIIISIIILVLIIIGVIIIILYNRNAQIKHWIDKYILGKEVLQNTSVSIELNTEDTPNIYAFNKYIGILNKNIFKVYNSSAKMENELNLEITNPLFASSNRFLAVAESKGQKVYLIEDKEIKWESSIEGNIVQVHVNKNGYVAVVISDTTYKTVISVYSTEGKKLFNTYLSNTRTVDISISNDNKFLAIAEIDTSGTMIQSNIRIVSIDKAQTESENSMIKRYTGENNNLITNIKYQDKNRLVCMYTDSIHIIENDVDSVLSENKDKKITFTSIGLNNNTVNVEEKSTGLFTADSILNITNTNN